MRAAVSAQVAVSAALVLLGPVVGEGAMAGPEGPWTPVIRQADGALARKEYSAALRAANEAYALARRTSRWDGMVLAGDLYRRIGEVTGLRSSFDRKTREAYQNALFRARQQASVEGVLRVAEGYVALGDQQMVALVLRVADRLAAGDPEAQADVRLFRARLGDSGLTAKEVSR